MNRGLRSGDQDWRVALFVLARSDQRDCAFVLTSRGVFVEAFVGLWRDGKDKRQQQGYERAACDQDAEVSSALAHYVATLRARMCFSKTLFGRAINDALLDIARVLVYETGRMIGPAKIYFIVFGLLTIVGGVMGYARAGSMASIIAGSISGILLLLAAFLLPGNAAAGLAIGLVVSIALAGKFVPALLNTGQVMPAGLMSVLSVIGVIVAIVAWLKK